MSLFSKEQAEEIVPAQRVIAFANIDLKKYLEKEVLKLVDNVNVTWDVEYHDDCIAANGTLEIPISLIYEAGDLDNETVIDDLVLAQLAIAGKPKLNKEIAEEADLNFDPFSTIDVEKVILEARKRKGALLSGLRTSKQPLE